MNGKAKQASLQERLHGSPTTTWLISMSGRPIRQLRISRQHAKNNQPFFMDVNFMKMHNPTNPAEAFRGKSKLGNYSDSMLEFDANVGRIVDAIRAEAPDSIVILTCDNGAWQDAWPDAGVTPFRGEKGSSFEGASACLASCGRPARFRPEPF